MDDSGGGRQLAMTGVRSLLVGIDIGTTLTKAGVVDLDGREVVHAAVPTLWQHAPTGGHARPADLFASVVDATADVLAAAPPGEVVGVGVTSMAETAVLLDASGQALGPAPAWHDVRAAEDFARLKSEFGTEALGRRTGLGTSQIPTVATLRWLMRNVADARRAVSALSVAEWVICCLGGETAAEASLASRTGALSIASVQWWPEVLDWAGVPRTIFPAVRSAGTSFGRVRNPPGGLERLEGAVLTVAGHDHLCASVGIGAVGGSQVMDSCGTAEALVRAVRADPDRDLGAGLSLGIEIGCHVLAGHHALIGGLSLGLNLTPVLDQLGVQSRQGLTELDAPALALGDPGVPAAVDRSTVASLRARSDARVLGTLRDGGSADRIWWTAVASAVAGSRKLLDGLEQLGGPVTEVRVSGGWSRNPLLRQLKAAVFPDLRFPLVREAGIRGAALLSALAAGVHGSVAEFPQPELEHLESARQPAFHGPSRHGPATTREGSSR